MRKKEMREVEVARCDFCTDEAENGHLDRCPLCRREMCGDGKHAAYSVEIYRYRDGERKPGVRICTRCVALHFAEDKSTIGDFLDKLLELG